MAAYAGAVAAMAAVAGAMYYGTHRSHKHKDLSIHADRSNPTVAALLDAMPALDEGYRITPWLTNGHMATVLCAMFRSRPKIEHHREEVIGDDGGHFVLDWHHGTTLKDAGMDARRPVVLILHGLTGGSEDTQVRHLAQAVAPLNVRVCMMNYRGCGDAKLSSRKVYSAAQTDDVRHTVELLASRYPDAKVLAIGFSLGAIILTKYLSEEGENAHVTAAMCVSNPWDLPKASKSLEQFPSNVIYNARLNKKLRTMVERNREILGDAIDYEQLKTTKTIKEFDAEVIVKLFGYESVAAYYEDACSVKHARNVKVPMLCLNAEDDMFSPPDGTPIDMHTINPNIIIVVSKYGGHVAFPQGFLPFSQPSFMDTVFHQYATAVLKLL